MDKIQIILEAVERSKAALAEATKQIDDITKAANKQQTAYQKLTAVADKYQGTLLAIKVAAAAIVASFVLLSHSVIENADRMNKQASQLNVTTERLSAYAFAADLANVSTDEFGQSLAFLNRALGEAATEGTGAAKAFKQLGLDPKQFKDPLDALRGIADAFHDSEGAAQKALIAQELFGRGSQRMVSFLNEGSEGLDKAAAEAEKFGIVLSGKTAQQAEDFNDNLTRMKAIATGAAQQLADKYLPVLIEIESFLIRNSDAVQTFVKALLGISAAILAIFGAAQAINATVTAINAGKAAYAAISGLFSAPAIVAATAALGPYIIAVAAIVAAIWTGVEAWKAFKAQQEEATSVKNLATFNKGFRDDLVRKIGELESAGKLSVEKAQQLRAQIDAAFAETKRQVEIVQPVAPGFGVPANRSKVEVIDKKSADEQNNLLRKVGDELLRIEGIRKDISEGSATAGKKVLEPLVPEDVLKARAQGQADLQQAQNTTTLTLFRNAIDQEEAEYKLSFDRRLITVDEFNAKLQLVNEKRFTVEQDFAQRENEVRKKGLEELQKTTSDPATKEKAVADLAVLAQELQTKLAEIDAKRVAAATQTEQQIAAARKGVVSQTVAQIQQTEQAAQTQFQTSIQQTDALRAKGAITGAEATQRQIEARKEYLQSLADEKASLEGVLATVEKLNTQSPGLFSPEEVGQLKNQIGGVSALGQQTAAETPIGENDFQGQFAATFGQLQDQANVTAATIAGTFKDVFNSAIGSISQGITGLITGTLTWGQALRQIGTSILTSVVSSIVQIGVRWIATQLLMAVAGKAIMAASTAAAAPFAASSAAMWAPAALAASIASYGAAAGVGTAALTSATATIGPIMSAFSAAGATGFEEGGLVPGAPSLHDNRLAHVASGEYIFDTASVMDRGAGWFAGLHAAIRAGNVEGFFANQRSASPRVGRSHFATGGLVGGQSDAAGAAGNSMAVSVGFLDTRQREREFLRREGVQVVIDELGRRGTIVGA